MIFEWWNFASKICDPWFRTNMCEIFSKQCTSFSVELELLRNAPHGIDRECKRWKKKMTTNTQIFLVNKRRPMNRKRHFHRTIRNQYGTFILDFVRVFMRMIVLLMKAPCISNLKKRGRRELGMVDVHRKSIARYRNAFSSDVKYIKCQ
jgi:hypothetical protein